MPKSLLNFTPLVALALAWFGYFTPWVMPAPAALQLSSHDFVEWLTFMQTVRDGTFPVSRLDLLWPLAALALLTALLPSAFQPSTKLSLLRKLIRWPDAACLSLALLAAGLIFPAYPFVLTAYNDPELGPQFWLGAASGLLAFGLYLLSHAQPRLALVLSSVISLVAVLTSIRGYVFIQPPLTDMLTRPAPVGAGFVCTVIGFTLLALSTSIRAVASSK